MTDPFDHETYRLRVHAYLLARGAYETAESECIAALREAEFIADQLDSALREHRAWAARALRCARYVAEAGKLLDEVRQYGQGYGTP